MPEDINLLPEDLRKREEDARRQAADESQTPRFSSPSEHSHEPAAGEPPGRWQQLMSALRANISAGATGVKSSSVRPPAPTAPPPSPPVADKQPIMSVAPPIKATAPIAKPGSAPRAKPFSQAGAGGTRPPGNVPSTILDVNLIPARESKQLSRQAVVAMSTVVLSALAVVVVGYVALRAYVSRQSAASEAVQQEVILLQQELENARGKAEQSLAIRSRLQILSEMLLQPGHWENFFTWLESKTIPVVQLISLAADADGSVTLSGQAPTLTEVGRQMLAFDQSQEVIEVSLADVSVESSRGSGLSSTVVNFTFTLKLPASLFMASSE